MAFDLASFNDAAFTEDVLHYLVDGRAPHLAARRNRLWDYYRNPLLPVAGPAAAALNANSRSYVQAQEVGLPARITGVVRHGGREQAAANIRRKEVVVENDIAWRVNTMVDFLFPRAVQIRSRAADPALAETIDQVIAAVLDANGGTRFLQELALLGSVYGFVDIALRIPAGPAAEAPLRPPASTPSGASGRDERGRPGTSLPSAGGAAGSQPATLAGRRRAVEAGRRLALELIAAPRVVPVLDEDDYHRLRYWVQRYEKSTARVAPARRAWLGLGRRRGPAPVTAEVVEILGPTWWQRYEDRTLVAEGPNVLGRVPVVHVQNLSLPASYEGLSDVEPLIALQDELNTRLSDRANRVTYQSFKMYLGKGIEDFLERPVGPGQMWATQNLDASIEEFGSDHGSPSEDAHIEQVRQALDKVSGVTPLAAGLIRGNVGNLSSATALKVVLSGLLAKTAKKRLTYERGLQEAFALCLAWLDRAGALRTAPEQRRVQVTWPNPLPSDEGEQLRNAQIKAQLGVPADRLLAELGYDPAAS